MKKIALSLILCNAILALSLYQPMKPVQLDGRATRLPANTVVITTEDDKVHVYPNVPEQVYQNINTGTLVTMECQRGIWLNDLMDCTITVHILPSGERLEL